MPVSFNTDMTLVSPASSGLLCGPHGAGAAPGARPDPPLRGGVGDAGPERLLPQLPRHRAPLQSPGPALLQHAPVAMGTGTPSCVHLIKEIDNDKYICTDTMSVFLCCLCTLLRHTSSDYNQ